MFAKTEPTVAVVPFVVSARKFLLMKTFLAVSTLWTNDLCACQIKNIPKIYITSVANLRSLVKENGKE